MKNETTSVNAPNLFAQLAEAGETHLEGAIALLAAGCFVALWVSVGSFDAALVATVVFALPFALLAPVALTAVFLSLRLLGGVVTLARRRSAHTHIHTT